MGTKYTSMTSTQILINLIILVYLFFFCVSINIDIEENKKFSWIRLIVILTPIVNIIYVIARLFEVSIDIKISVRKGNKLINKIKNFISID